jgi:hypothetical protein
LPPKRLIVGLNEISPYINFREFTHMKNIRPNTWILVDSWLSLASALKVLSFKYFILLHPSFSGAFLGPFLLFDFI